MSKSLSLISALLCTFIWGTTFIAQDTGMDDIGPFTFNAVRFFVGFLAIVPLVFLFEVKKFKSELKIDLAKVNIIPSGLTRGERAKFLRENDNTLTQSEYDRIFKKQNDIKELLEYSINRLYPELLNEDDKYLKFFDKITSKQMNLILNWQRVGFVHGVMNTDNMSLSGETIDYGPCAFLDEYNPNKVFSSIDKNGRYAFNNQPKIALWNLARLAETFLHLVDSKEEIAIKKIEYILKKYETEYNDKWLEMMKDKIGINDNHEKDNELIKELLDLMQIFKLDHTNTFILIENNTLQKFDFMLDWISKLNQRKELNKKIKKPKYSNPKIVPRNHIVEKVLNESANGNFKNLNKFISLLKNPYESSIQDEYMREPTNEEKVYQTFCGT